jgi:HAE1 family hydrophobic/amphiphilic exporter-1
MAIAVIGGLLVSTLLSLIFVPSFFTIMEGLSGFFGRLFGRFIGPKEEDGPHMPPKHDHAPVTMREAAE